MEIQTNIPITYHIGLGTSQNGIVNGKISRYSIIEFNRVLVVYSYTSNGVKIKYGSFEVLSDDVETLYTAVKGLLPDINAGFLAWDESLLYEAFKIEMVKTFDDLTNTSEIDFI